VVSSGTHGVEGFAGSGIQARLLEDGIVARLPARVSLLMIHALNPYGMAHLRRVTEDNVDLNRNFRDHTTPALENPHYERLAQVIAPRSLSFWPEAVAWARLLWYRLRAGRRAAQAAVSGGQYAHPDGLFYGGISVTWSNAQFRSILRRYLAGTARVVLVDIHTGLGPFGGAELILHVPADSPDYQRAVAIWGPDLVRTTATGQSVSAHVDASLKVAVPETVPDADVTAVTLELGTVPLMEAFKALRAENWLHHHGGRAHPLAPRIKACLLRAFHPDSSEWEGSVWTHGRAVVESALASLRD
jgi:hypothetical protein